MLTKISTYDPPFNFDESGEPDPILLLATRADERSIRWRFKPGREWFWIDHQSAGNGCHHPEFVGTILQIRPELLPSLRSLDGEYYGSNLGVFGVGLSEYVAYQSRLAATHRALCCETSYQYLEEAVYPIDYSVTAVQALSSDVLPHEPNMLVDWKDELDEFLGCVGRWHLVILGQNSD